MREEKIAAGWGRVDAVRVDGDSVVLLQPGEVPPGAVLAKNVYRSIMDVPWTKLHLHPSISGAELWINSRYEVHVRRPSGEEIESGQGAVHLSIKTNTRTHDHDWRDYQRIKNEVLGPDWWAYEVYPPEEFLVDTCNQFHLWCYPPGAEPPFGFRERLVCGKPSMAPGGVTAQRSFDGPVDGESTPEEMEALGKAYTDG